MSYLYGVRLNAAEDPLILALREVGVRKILQRSLNLFHVKQELYTQPYDTIDWPAQRDNVSAADLHSPRSGIFDIISIILSAY